MQKDGLKFLSIEILETLIGSFIIALAVSLFLLPNELSSGGFSGIATIAYYLFKIPVGNTILFLNFPLFLFALIKLGKKFIIKSAIGTISLSLFIDWIDKIEPLTNDKILACVYGGILTGLGTALILRANSSTGGSDLVSLIIKEYSQKYQTGKLIAIIDFIIVMLNVVFLKKIEIGLYSAITIYLMGKVIDVIFEGIDFTKLLFIVSDQNEEIAKIIGSEVKRGTSGLYGKGMYTNNEKLILMCAVDRKDLAEVKKIVRNVDPNAFVIVTNSREVLGTGFKEYRTKNSET